MSMKSVNASSVGDHPATRVGGMKRSDRPDKGGTSEADARHLKRSLGNAIGQTGDAPTDGEREQEGLSSLFSQALGGLACSGRPTEKSTPPEAALGGATAASAATMQCEELVERILASPPSADGAAEVRLKIDKPWLPDTEVRLTMSPEGRLEVDFQADATDAQRFLLPNLDTLRERLEEKCAGGVTVRLTESTRDNGGDGRSRNRRSVLQELDGD